MKKQSWLFLLLLCLRGWASAQNPVVPECQIIRFQWKHQQQGNTGMETGMPSASSPNTPATQRDNRQPEVLRQQVPTKDRLDEMEAQRQQAQRPQVKIHSTKNLTAESRYSYMLEVKNTAAKQIVELSWDYVFLDPRNQQKRCVIILSAR